ncbi:RmlC-like jelly roll fold protein [Metarhizium album ARSEF 1941]|uniref:CENP-C homolog n=1 Tax=Metarhizium album (strain ARSEF 1941) TaxID=1081103 RepID=A0A0B2WV88_METAS|nr:RmlC-like jelly roll fold protein [Metarhizium album ARSEF 1941]KHN97367.1 RmlC-like jelly roll fold protein [Metarhizium album ARSEF 1941]
MARSVKRPRIEPQAFHQLGKQGRKTGITLQDRGERDEHGMQPIDSIFSPHEAKPAFAGDDASDGSEGADMSIASSNGPGPQTLLKNRHSITYPIPKGKSPVKTGLRSPAKRNPRLEYPSSPSRSTLLDDNTVTRKIDFAAHSNKPPRSSTAKAFADGLDTSRPSPPHTEDHGANPPADPAPGSQNDPTMSDMVEQSMQLVNAMHSDNFTAAELDQGQDDLPLAGGGDDFVEEEPRPTPARPSPANPSPMQQAQRKPPPMPVPSIFGTKKRASVEIVEEGEESERAADRGEEEQRQEERPRTSMPPPPPPPRPAPSASRETTAPAIPKPKLPMPKTEVKPVKRGRGRPRKSERRPAPAKEDDDDEGDETFMEIQRAPPMPRARGLVSVRNEASDTQTRSGRRSFRPLEYWRGERVVRGGGEAEAEGAQDADSVEPGDFLLPSTRQVMRMPDDAPPSRRAPRSKTRTKAKSAAVREGVQEDEELEEWEMNEGTISGDIVLWEPEHEFNPPMDSDEVQIARDRLAIAADAIETRDIPSATFRFAKTLTLPFIGAGVVDLAPGAEKRPKNSRKMHMVFFVHYGKVLVTINREQFRISAGGTWFVPRGNYYSLVNDYEVPARIFFAQACEVAPPPEE